MHPHILHVDQSSDNSVSLTIAFCQTESSNENLKNEETGNRKRSRKQDLRSTLRKQLDDKIPFYEMDPNDPTLTPNQRKKIEKAKKSREYRITQSNSLHAAENKVKELQLELIEYKRKYDLLVEENKLLKETYQPIPEDLADSILNSVSEEYMNFLEEDGLLTKFSDVCEHQNDQKL